MNETQFVYSTLLVKAKVHVFSGFAASPHSPPPSAPLSASALFVAPCGQPHKSPVVFIPAFLTAQSQTVTCAGIFPVILFPLLAHVCNISLLFANRQSLMLRSRCRSKQMCSFGSCLQEYIGGCTSELCFIMVLLEVALYSPVSHYKCISLHECFYLAIPFPDFFQYFAIYLCAMLVWVSL